MLRESASTVVLTGAGVSVPSGIPDFRTPGTGLWENVDPMEVAHIDAFHRDTARFWSYYRPRFHELGSKEPNGAHLALAELERRGLVAAVITQNIDRLHGAAGSKRVIEVHGSIETSSCTACGESVGMDEVEGLFTDSDVAVCDGCGEKPPRSARTPS
jgi:NAD-dependent deacetylase